MDVLADVGVHELPTRCVPGLVVFVSITLAGRAAPNDCGVGDVDFDRQVFGARRRDGTGRGRNLTSSAFIARLDDDRAEKASRGLR